MGKVLVNETSLNGIASAIREKNGETTKYKPSEMAAAITALEIGGGGSGGEDGVPNPLIYSGNCDYLFHKDGHSWIIKNYSDRVKFQDVSSATSLFYDNKEIKKIPSITQVKGKSCNWSKAFNSSDATEIGDIYNWNGAQYDAMFSSAKYLRYMPNFIKPVASVAASYNAANAIFNNCHSLRELNADFMSVIGSQSTSAYSSLYKEMFLKCYALNEVLNLPVCKGSSAATSNLFGDTFDKCYRLKRITFATNSNGTPIVVQWKSQTIELYDGVGWLSGNEIEITSYNSGITADKKVTGSNYDALKNDPDWYTGLVNFSRYNHDSAVETINTLPDTSAYLATQSGATNTIKFRNEAGMNTDGGKIGNLTEEEIAVATAKGWTVGYQT